LQSKVVSDLRKEIQKLQKKVQMEAQAKARNRADQQEGMIQILQKKTAASSNVWKSVSTGNWWVNQDKGRLIVMVKMKEVAMKKSEDNKIAHGGTSFVDKDDEEEVDEDPVVKDFRWKSVAKKSGYLIVRFDNEEVDQQMELKPLLHNYPELVIWFMWEKYSQSEQTMHYVEQCAKGGITLGGKKKQVMKGFKSLRDYLEGKTWKDITKPRFQQQPAWDENVSRQKVKSKGKKKSTPGTEHQMPHSGTKDHVGQGYETNRSRVANNNLGDADVTQAELGVTADPGMKLQARTEPTNLESNMEEVGEDVYLQTESTDFEI
jgi:hypothetical protein